MLVRKVAASGVWGRLFSSKGSRQKARAGASNDRRFRERDTVGYRSGQTGQTVNLLA